MPALDAILEKNIRLIDYEKITNENGQRLVAFGKLDGYFEGTVGLLDTAAGVLLVQEAGGIVSDFWGQGKEYFEKNVTYVSGNKSAHLYIVEKINNT